MNKDIKARWVEALRSGKYKQGHQILHDEDKFCCLGVLCDLHSKETNNPWGGYRGDPRYLGASTSLPADVIVWAGLEHQNPSVEHRAAKVDPNTPDYEIGTLIGLNDNRFSFPEIADVIEKEL